MDDDEEVVLTYEDTVLKRSDLNLLRGPCYLNDQIIGFYFRYLSSLFNSIDILFVPPSVSFWLTNFDDDLDSVKNFVEPMKLSSKQLIFFTVNDNGTHWSLLVYYRNMNAFVHHDTLKGANDLHATKLYQAVKGFVGAAAGSSLLSKSASKGRHKKRKDVLPTKSTAASAADPSFIECHDNTPQQMNGYDCGLYVMAIARTVCQWHASKSKDKVNNWFSAIGKHVHASVELTMRTEVMKLIEDLRLGD